MKQNIYVVACNADPTCIVIAANKQDAIRIASNQANIDLGDCNDQWTAYEINDYFSTEYEPQFFGWVVNADSKYL